MNSFDEIQVEEDEAYAEWLWRHELAIREELDREGEVEMIDEINRIFAEAACEPCPF